MADSLVLELESSQTTHALVQALKLYRFQLDSSIRRSKRKLAWFETQYGVSTDTFLAEMSAEDLVGGDMEYVEWAGEAHLLAGLKSEIEAIDRVQHQLH